MNTLELLNVSPHPIQRNIRQDRFVFKYGFNTKMMRL